MRTRREFLGLAMAAPAFAKATAGKLGASITTKAGDRTSMCLAYTSFAVRMLQGRDILKSTAAALPADGLFDLCEKFGAGGAQLDWSQIVSFEPAALDALRKRVEASHLALELSVPSKYLETPEAYAEMVRVATRLGITRIRVALLYGRRYETFKTRDEWTSWAARWRTTLVGMRTTFDASPIMVGIENHKDWHATELVDLLQLIASPKVGACVDFGNNISLLESPLDTVRTLAPYAVTTHLKDMAVKPTAEGFGLSEVPLGEGFLPLAEIIAALRAQRPDVPMCLEMITRDPLPVPYKSDRYWVAIDRPSPDVLTRFEQEVLGKAWTRDLPTITGLAPEAQVAAEDENVRKSVDYARRTLKL
jgi:sugar phosphate isomerase/epimerase